MNLKKLFAVALISSATFGVNAAVFEDSPGGERDVFSAFDSDNDGKISMTELVEAMIHVVGKDKDGDHFISRHESQQAFTNTVFNDSVSGEKDVFSVFDGDGNDKISMTEVVESVLHLVAKDKDGDHFISRAELGAFGDSIGGERDIFTVFDSDNDGKISMTEVVEAMIHVVKRDKDGDHFISRGESSKSY